MNLKNMERPVVLLSKCIEHEACRYDGSMVGDSFVGGWVVRFNEPYLKGQTIFSPYPRAILDVADSGKGID